MSQAQGTKGMIFLDSEHPIIQETLEQKLAKDGKREPCDITCSDLDNVKYRIFVERGAENTIIFQYSMPCYSQLMQMGGSTVVDGMYGPYKVSSKEPGYDVAFKIDVDSPKGDAASVAKKFAEIKMNLLGAPFRKCFEALAKGSTSSLKPMVVPFRVLDRIILVPGSDRVLVYFAIYFTDPTDRVLAKVFLQEFSETNRKIPQAPSVAFTVECPADLNRVSDYREDRQKPLGYVQFQIFKSHVEGAKLEKAVQMLTMFRSYIHYHIKASKAHLHSRMRHRVELLLKVLRRADPETDEEGKSKKAFRTY